MRRAFTLVELMVVVALMGLMSALAIGNYSSIMRGMDDRAALDAARTIVEAALQRANIDRTKVYLYRFDEVLKIDSDLSVGVVAGLLTAVRPVGRITQVPGDGLLCDEFNDLNVEETDEGSPESASDREKNAAKFRLYNIRKQTFAVVLEGGAGSAQVPVVDLEEGDTPLTLEVHGFKKVSGGDFEVGDLYGQEFAATRLPPGYIFGSTVQMSGPSDLGQKQVGGSPIVIEPTYRRVSDIPQPIHVYRRRPDGTFEDIGDVKQVAKDSES